MWNNRAFHILSLQPMRFDMVQPTLGNLHPIAGLHETRKVTAGRSESREFSMPGGTMHREGRSPATRTPADSG